MASSQPEQTLAELKATRRSIRVAGELISPPLAKQGKPRDLEYQRQPDEPPVDKYDDGREKFDWVVAGAGLILFGIVAWMMYGAYALCLAPRH